MNIKKQHDERLSSLINRLEEKAINAYTRQV